jgi:KipI family sensor histidine kinase inhibitor
MSAPERRVHPFGDGAVVAEVDSVSAAHGLAAAVEGAPGWAGVEDVVVGYRSVTVVADPGVADLSALADELARIPAPARDRSTTRRREIPVAFDGPDLEDVATHTGCSPARVVEELTGTDLVVAFLGFLPGFAYLEGLPPILAGIPRRSSPRPAVAAGSLAVGGGFAAIYPQASPGGWQLLGHTGFALFDPQSPPFATLGPADTVRLRAVRDPGSPSVRARPPLRSEAARRAVVEEPGFLSMVQDLGRVGVARLGVPRAGAADAFAVRVANRLVGNDDGAAALEVTALGPRLRFDGPAHVAVAGDAEVTLDGRAVEADTVVPVAPGQVLSVGRTLEGLRCYLAVGGGFDVAPVFGSRSSDVLTGLGPGPLRPGDVLGIGPPTRPRGRIVRVGAPRTDHVLRVVSGPDDLRAGAAERLAATWWEVGTDSDRVGMRLCGDGIPDAPTSGVPSKGMVTGAVQVPPDGRPVALLCDHATVGGYPVVATVVRADLGVLGQCRPGDAVQFELVDLAEAERARASAERSLERTVVGWYPVRSD